MPVFKDTDQLYKIMDPLWNTLANDPEVQPKFSALGLSVKFVISDPQGYVHLGPPNVVTLDQDLPADITMIMSGDTVHAFWLRKINLVAALAMGKIKAQGPVSQMFAMLPLLKPAYELYPRLAKEQGLV